MARPPEVFAKMRWLVVLVALFVATAVAATVHEAPIGGPSLTEKGMRLKSVILLGRHGNRAPDPNVRVICPKHAPQQAMYDAQGCGPGGMTSVGLRTIMELGKRKRGGKHGDPCSPVFVMPSFSREVSVVPRRRPLRVRSVRNSIHYSSCAFPYLTLLCLSGRLDMDISSVISEIVKPFRQ